MEAIERFVVLKAIFIILLFLGISIWSPSYAIPISLFLYLIISYVFVFFFFRSNERLIVINYFLTIMPIYFIYAFIVGIGFIRNGDFFIFPDQGYFFEISNDLGKLDSIAQVFKVCFIERAHIESEGAHFIFGSIAFIANNYFDGNNVFLQSLNVSFLAVLSNILVYKLLRRFLTMKLSYEYSLLYSLLSPVIFYSPWMLRDIHISLLYLIALNLTFRRISLINSIYFIIVFIITAQFRLEHALILIMFPLVHIYFNRESNLNVKKFWPIFIFVGTGVVLSVVIYLSNEIILAIEGFTRYSIHTDQSLDNSGLGSKLYSLPKSLKYIALVVNSQFTPLPPWETIDFSQNIFILISSLILGLVTVFWSYVFLYTLYFFLYSETYKKTPNSLLIFIVVTVIFLFLNTSNITVRRIMALYPIIFLVFAYFKERRFISINKSIVHWGAIISYAMLLVFYVIIKSYL